MIAIYHSADFDGIFCREIAKKFIPEAVLIGWNFGDTPVRVVDGETVVIMDLPPECCENLDNANVTWIDHHKTSIDKWSGKFQNTYLIDGVAACRLAWQWFTLHGKLPEKQDYVDRKVVEPYAINLAGEYDIWDKRNPHAEVFQYALKASTVDFQQLLTVAEDASALVGCYLQNGFIAQHYGRTVEAEICKDLTWLMEWEGVKFLCVNHARFNSLLFRAKDMPETGHQALLGFRFDGKKWMVSLYHSAFNKELDLSEIAKKHGGGGHKGACGFICSELPFKVG